MQRFAQLSRRICQRTGDTIQTPSYIRRFGSAPDASSEVDEQPTSQEIVAKCLCGAASLSLPAGTMPGQMSVCHCSMCRRASGAPYVAFVGLPRGLVQVPGLSTYAASAMATRGFCGKCGSFMYMDYGEPSTIWWTLGIFQNVPPAWWQEMYGDTQNCQIFRESAASWKQFVSELPHYDHWGKLRVDACNPESKKMWMEDEALLALAGAGEPESGSG
mmetsp:Transcript_4649/g.17487  ORF Transcript_4649/g.17487 Transcript_4649/m.17487 type:complete len:217 (-) Transcript_4649:225-875(-)|eukprot:CAMPEP_0203952638 /NCGR_PEP_ID=MMETSP0359-20131031/86228_1 /ASSEMBLY_ACC=CAM_ASM_000338 /TAXON_ID=268821 /ORGANISM="Scrippsiella Hangoei, Strain SHTV-5" /LENGTH=216 /DNA_ID=CAMNT_0050885691 /DNA_START=55 /DNA_END=705 /DNA_ORIENTATION=+